MKQAILISLIAISFTPIAASARQVAVPHDDLNLSLPADQARLERRVAQAIDTVCNAAPAPSSMLRSTRSVKCTRTALVDARAQVVAAIEAGSRAKLAARAQ